MNQSQPDQTRAPLHIAMWSGPRNISTAMMRSFENRSDTFVCDEPLYSHYLVEHGYDHPVRQLILDNQEQDANKVIEWLTGEIPNGKRVFYQKHMTHHMVDTVPRDWLRRATNAFLIRDPREMVTSLIKVIPEARLLDTGLPQQLELFERVSDHTGQAPPVLDSRDVLEHPRDLLEQFCHALGICFEDSMLEWPPGRRKTDGVWAPHWYAAVEESTGFAPYRPKDEEIPKKHLPMYEACLPYYEKLYSARIQPRKQRKVKS